MSLQETERTEKSETRTELKNFKESLGFLMVSLKELKSSKGSEKFRRKNQKESKEFEKKSRKENERI